MSFVGIMEIVGGKFQVLFVVDSGVYVDMDSYFGYLLSIIRNNNSVNNNSFIDQIDKAYITDKASGLY